LRRLADLTNAATALLGVAGLLAIVAVASPIAAFLHLTSTVPVLLTGIVLGFSVAIPVQRGVLQGAERFGAFTASTIVEAGTKVVASPVLALYFGVDGALIGLAIASFLTWCYNVIQLRRSGSGSGRLRLDLRRIALTWANVAVAVLAINALLFYDVILVRHYYSAVIAGLYGAAALAARALYMFIAFIPTIVLPKATARSTVGRGTRSLLIASVLTAAAIVGVALLAAAIAPRLIVSVIAGRAYADAGAYVFAYMLALGALALANVVTMYNIGLHRFDFVAPLALIAVGEILAVATWHANVHTTLLILCIGHSLALGSTLIRFRAPILQRRGAAPTAV
jgi:O-antigen/teichoic acid export membrane protein